MKKEKPVTLDDIIAKLAPLNAPGVAVVEISAAHVLIRVPENVQADVAPGESHLEVLGSLVNSLTPKDSAEAPEG